MLEILNTSSKPISLSFSVKFSKEDAEDGHSITFHPEERLFVSFLFDFSEFVGFRNEASQRDACDEMHFNPFCFFHHFDQQEDK